LGKECPPKNNVRGKTLLLISKGKESHFWGGEECPPKNIVRGKTMLLSPIGAVAPVMGDIVVISVRP
jgi:hypothetical protein